MLESAWEGHATALANASTEEFVAALDAFIKSAKIDLSKPSRVVYARDTRPSGPALIAALEDGLTAIGAEARNAGVTTTPILHYLVRSINTKGTKESYGEDSEEGYFTKLSEAFKKLVVRSYPRPRDSAIHYSLHSGWAPCFFSHTHRLRKRSGCPRC